MKPFRFSALVTRAIGIAGISTLSFGSASATAIYWDGTANPGNWSDAVNWTTDPASPAANPALAPGSNDVAVFVTDALTTAQTVNLNATQSVSGLATSGLVPVTTTLLGGSGAQTLNLGIEGIKHLKGGITIGSATAGLEVNISLQGAQIWDSSTSGATGIGPIIVQNNVSIGAGGDQTLTLTGSNTGSIINRSITDGAGSLGFAKTGSGTWTLAGTANTFSGTTAISAGIFRLTNVGALPDPTKVTVSGTGTLSLRIGGAGYTIPQSEVVRSAVTFTGATSNFALDTANGSFIYDSNLTGNFNFVKLGVNTLTLSGTNTYVGKTTVTEGTLALNSLSAKSAGALSVGASGTLTLVAGGSNFTAAQVDTVKNSTTFTAGAGLNLSTTGGDLAYPSAIGGGLRLVTSGTNTIFLTGNSDYTGTTTISAGTASVSDLQNGGINSNFGKSSNAATNLIIGAARLRYLGDGSVTDRLFSYSSSFTLDSSGGGPLIFSNTELNPASSVGARTITLSGYNKDDNTIGGKIADSGTTTNITNITKTGSSFWNLAGTNTYTGISRVIGGTLSFDYGSGLDPVSTGKFTINGGTLLFRGGAEGTTKSISTLQIGENHQAHGTLKLQAMNLKVNSLIGFTSAQRFTLIDLTAGGSIEVTALGSQVMHTVNGLLMNNADPETGARANVVVHDTEGRYGFATLSNGDSGMIQCPTLLTDLAVGDITLNSNITNYRIATAGTYTNTSTSANFSTLTVDSNNGPVVLNLKAGAIATNGAGRASLYSGANNVDINSTGSIGGAGIWFHNYLESSAALNINASLGPSNILMFGGTGFFNYGGAGFGVDFQLDGDTIFRTTRDQDIADAGAIFRISSGAVLELGADLNGTIEGDLTKAVGSAAGNFKFYGDSGLSAYTATPGGTRVVKFTTVAADVRTVQPLVWGTGYFMTNPETTTDGDYTLKLSSARSNATIEIQNPISFNGRSRVIDVADGAAEVDAVLSGVLSGGLHGFTKMGMGTLGLTGANTYTGDTRITQGTLRVNSTSLNPASKVRLDVLGKLHVTGTVYVAGVTIGVVTKSPGIVTDPQITGPGTLIIGTPPVTTAPYDQWVIDKALATGQSAPTFDADNDGLVNLIEYAVGTEPKTANGSVISETGGLPAVIRFNRAAGRTDITVVLESSATLAAPWTTIATSTAGAAYVSSVSGVAVTDTGAVTVTDNRPSPPVKLFYRLRATK